MASVATGLRIVFDTALDGPVWPALPGVAPATFGDTHLGPIGLLDRLETELGLLRRRPTASERAATLIPSLAATAGFWSASFEADELATCRRLLADRDGLALWGWNGEPAGARLTSLWSATGAAPEGVPDRLRRVISVLPRRHVDISRIDLLEPIGSLPPLWSEVLRLLALKGVEVTHRPILVAEAAGDLAAARTAPFRPTGDGSLRLLRSQGPLAAAEEVAASLASCGDLERCVIVNADGILESALARHGLPALGASVGPPASAALVRLVIATAFHPMDPAELHLLLCADPGPIPRGVARALIRALGSFPARGSTAWSDALAKAIADLPEERRDDVAKRVAALLDPVVARDDKLGIDALAQRLRALSTWARGRAQSLPVLIETAQYADAVVNLARLTQQTGFDRTELRRLVDDVGAPELARASSEVGLASVREPAAVIGEARVIVWWNFTRTHAPTSMRLRLSNAERAALLAAGITPPDPGQLMTVEARKWRRPLQLATEALLLVCPRTDEGAERAHPHPLWDELRASVPPDRDIAPLVSTVVSLPAAARRNTVTLRPVLAPVATAAVSSPLDLGEKESPSSIEQLLACSLAWTLQRRGKLYAGIGTGPGEPSPLLYGNLAHHVLAQVFGTKVTSPDEAAQYAEALFDGSLSTLAESLLLPDFQGHRAELRRGLVESARELGRLLRDTGATVRGVELEVAGTLGTATVSGRTDMLLSNPDTVIDFKWGSATYRWLMESGTAFQLVAYAALARSGTNLPDVAYLSLQRQLLVASAGTSLPDARTPGRHTASEMLDGAVARLGQRRAELANGQLEAPAAIEDVDDGLADGVMRLSPKCDYCSFGVLCGRRVR